MAMMYWLEVGADAVVCSTQLASQESKSLGSGNILPPTNGDSPTTFQLRLSTSLSFPLPCTHQPTHVHSHTQLYSMHIDTDNSPPLAYSMTRQRVFSVSITSNNFTTNLCGKKTYKYIASHIHTISHTLKHTQNGIPIMLLITTPSQLDRAGHCRVLVTMAMVGQQHRKIGVAMAIKPIFVHYIDVCIM